MQTDKAKKLVEVLIGICDDSMRNFYIAGATGMVSNKMACVDFAFRMLYDTSQHYNLISRDNTFTSSVNSVVQNLSPDTESVERAFGVMFNAVQQHRANLKAWQDALDQG